MPRSNPFRQRLAQAILGRGKSLVPSLNPIDGVNLPNMNLGGGTLNSYTDKASQVAAATGWVFAANSAIVEPTAAVEIILNKILPDGTKEQVTQGPAMELLELIHNPNLVHTGEQMRQLHFTYMNLVGESYIFMRDRDGSAFVPSKGRLPAALDIFPSHLVQFMLGETYTKSVVKMGLNEYPAAAFIRDLNPDPMNPYNGRSIIAASAATINLEEQMKAWNANLFANGARPSLIFQTDAPLDDEAYARFKEQFTDDHTGTENAHKPLLIEGGKATPWMLNQTDLDFLESRKWSQTEILAMFKVSPGMVGAMENVNRSNLEAGFYQNTVINVVPRIRQFVRQLNATLVKVYDPQYELDFVNPVPEDIAAKLAAAVAGVDKWWTKDEIRKLYGDEALPGGVGEKIIVSSKGALSLDDVLAGDTLTPDDDVEDPIDPDEDSHDDLTVSSGGSKSLRAKQIAARDFPDLYEGLDIDMDALGCIMLNTKTMPVTKFVQDGEADLIDSTTRHDHTMGAVAEEEAHVTLLFGLLDNGNTWKDKVDTVLDGWNIKTVKIGKVDMFDLKDSYAIIGHVEKTAKLVDGHERLTLLPHINTFSEYSPHLTLAYVKHDKTIANKWVKALGAQYDGKTVSATGINYGDEPAESTKTLTGVKKKT